MSASILLRGQLRYLNEHGFKVSVLSAPGPELESVARREGVDVHAVSIPTKISLLSDLGALVKICAALRKLRPMVVQAGTPPAARLGLRAARILGVPVRIYSLQGLAFENLVGPPRRAFERRERGTVQCAHEVFCVSDSLRRKFRSLGLDPDGKAHVLGSGSSNGVDAERFRPAQDDERTVLRQRLRIPHNALVVGWVGRLTPNKGVADLAQVFLDVVLARCPDAHLLLVGGRDPYHPISERLYARLVKQPRVHLAGHVDDAAPYYRAMDVFAFPSLREGFPNAVLEASASALPVAAYAATGTVDAVQQGETGRLVPVGDCVALGQAIVEYLNAPAFAQSHGAAGRRRVQTLFGRERIWRLTRDALLDAVRHHAG